MKFNWKNIHIIALNSLPSLIDRLKVLWSLFCINNYHTGVSCTSCKMKRCSYISHGNNICGCLCFCLTLMSYHNFDKKYHLFIYVSQTQYILQISYTYFHYIYRNLYYLIGSLGLHDAHCSKAYKQP